VAVEFALTATLLILLVLAALVYGIQFSARIVATQAASEGARAAAAGLTVAERQSLAEDAARRVLDSYGGIAATRTVRATPVGNPVTRMEVFVAVDLTAFGFQRLGGILPIGTERPSATVSVQVGGF